MQFLDRSGLITSKLVFTASDLQLRTTGGNSDAALLRKVGREGPIGVNALAQAYGGRKDNGSNPNTPAMGSRHIIRTALQQLSEAGLISMKETKTVQSVDGDQKLYSGRILTASGQKLLDEVAHSVRPTAEESYPGLSKY